MLNVDHSDIDGPPLAVKCVRKFGSTLGGEVMFVCVCGGGGSRKAVDSCLVNSDTIDVCLCSGTYKLCLSMYVL